MKKPQTSEQEVQDSQEKWMSQDNAQAAFNAERDAEFWESIKANKRAVLWSLLISTSVIMEGYDTSLLPSFFAYPTFLQKYGQYYGEIDRYQLTGAWQSGLLNGANSGVIIGGFINGWAAHRYGYKRTMTVAMIMMAAVLFIVFFSPNPTVLVIGEILCGIPWGVFATTGPAYASEVCPTALRGYLTVVSELSVVSRALIDWRDDVSSA
jgi:MFS transporter, SP family, general alpha glucoside:H+ symporter